MSTDKIKFIDNPYLPDFQRDSPGKNCCALHIRRPLTVLPMSERSVSEKQKRLGEQKMKIRKSAVLTIITCATFLALSVHASPLAQDASSGQTDEVLFHKATVAAQYSGHAEARSLMETLINSHPDSDYGPLAKFAIANAWYAEGSYQQAELEYRDFVTFFPNRPEVAEARTRIALIESGKNKK